jgi:cobalt-zinc-cadmium efflux system protein
MSASHDHSHAPVSFDRAFGIGIALNLAFVGVEAFYGWKADSLALLADAGHNLSDVIGLVLAWGGALAGRLRPDDRHTYGWKRGSMLAAFINALLLLVAMGALAWEAVQRLQSPLAVQGVTIMVVASIGIVINTATALLFMRGSESDLNIRGAFLHMAADALVSAGVVVAGGLALWFGWTWLDPVVSLAIAVVIVAGTWSLFRQSLHLLFDGVPEGVDLNAVRNLLKALPGVTDVHDLHVWAMSTSEIALTAHLVMPDGHADDAWLQQATALLHDRFDIEHVTLQIVRVPFTVPCAAPAPSAGGSTSRGDAGARDSNNGPVASSAAAHLPSGLPKEQRHHHESRDCKHPQQDLPGR